MIPILDLKAQYESIKKDEINAAIAEVLESTQFVLGPAVRDLEQRVADYCGCKYGVGAASGTDALRLTLMALGIGPGHEQGMFRPSFWAKLSPISRFRFVPRI